MPINKQLGMCASAAFCEAVDVRNLHIILRVDLLDSVTFQAVCVIKGSAQKIVRLHQRWHHGR